MVSTLEKRLENEPTQVTLKVGNMLTITKFPFLIAYKKIAAFHQKFLQLVILVCATLFLILILFCGSLLPRHAGYYF